MSVQKCRTLASLIPVIAEQVDQGLDEEGQLSWRHPAAFQMACNEAYHELFRRGDALDVKLNRAEAVISGVLQGAGTSTVEELLLPEDLRALVEVRWIGPGGKDSRPLKEGSDYDIAGWVSDTESLFVPKRRFGLETTDGRPTLRLNKPVASSQQFRVVYTYHPLPLAHGVVQDASANFLTLDKHEAVDDDYFAGVRFHIWKGKGYGQIVTAGSYVGATRTCGVTPALTTVPDKTSWYTTRPDLHPDMEQGFILSVLIWLARKNHDSRVAAWSAERDGMLSSMSARLKTLNRRAPLRVRDRMSQQHCDGFRQGLYR